MKPFRHSLRRLGGRSAPFDAEPALEPIYRDLFLRDLAQLGEEDFFYPTGGAANYSLLYLILRIANEARPGAVLDIGAGQSTLLWNALARRGRVGRVVTLEDDANWAARIQAQVAHEVVITPLRPIRIGTVQALGYDWDAARARGPFSVIVCDGPIGTPRYSRCGVLAMIDETLPSDFVVILDDVERAGEQDTVALVHDRLQALGRTYTMGITRAAKSQAVFAGGSYEAMCHL